MSSHYPKAESDVQHAHACWGARIAGDTTHSALIGIYSTEEEAQKSLDRWTERHGSCEASLLVAIAVDEPSWTAGFVPWVGASHENLGPPVLEERELGRSSRPGPQFTVLRLPDTERALYFLWHEYQDNWERAHRFNIGIFSSLGQVTTVIRSLALMPGFASYPHGFRVISVSLGVERLANPWLEWEDD